MSASWTLYQKLLGISGSYADERYLAIDEAVNSFVEGIINDPAYQHDAIVNGEITPLVASRESTTSCSIKAMPGTSIHIGDMVECFGSHWIIVELYTDKVGIINGEMWLCNHEIKFQNNSDVVHSRFCIVDDGTYSKKSSDPDAFVMSNTYKVYITIDDATKRIYVDKRIGFGEIYTREGACILEVYKVIGIDLKSKNHGNGSHLMVMTMQRDVYNADSDSISDNICDVFVDAENGSFPASNGRCVIEGKNTIRIGTKRKYVATYLIDGENSNVDAESVWDVVAPSGISISTDGNICIVDVPLDSDLVGEHVIIRVSDKNERYGKFEKEVQVIAVG